MLRDEWELARRTDFENAAGANSLAEGPTNAGMLIRVPPANGPPQGLHGGGPSLAGVGARNALWICALGIDR